MEWRKCYKLAEKTKPQADWKAEEWLSHFSFKKFTSSVFNHYLSYSHFPSKYPTLPYVVIDNIHMHYAL